MNVQPHRSLLRQHVDGQHVEHHFDIAHRVDVAVEVDVAVNHAVFGRRGRAYRTDLARLVRRGRGIDDGVGMRVAHPREVDRRTALQVDHRPLRHGAAEFAACGIGQREVSRREHPAVIADPRSHGVVGVLRGLAVEFDGHARKHPRMVVGIQRIDSEPLAVGVDARGVEYRAAQRRDCRPQREIHVLRFNPVIIARFFSHCIEFYGYAGKDTIFSVFLEDFYNSLCLRKFERKNKFEVTN